VLAVGDDGLDRFSFDLAAQEVQVHELGQRRNGPRWFGTLVLVFHAPMSALCAEEVKSWRASSDIRRGSVIG
jgi:hypothetical protein